MKKAYERLIEYSRFPSASDEACENCPSTAEQLEFSRYLVSELKEIGVSDAYLDEHGYVYGSVEASEGYENEPSIGLIAHVDVVRDVEYRDVKAHVIKNYDGKDVVLNREENIVMSPSDYPSLCAYVGDDLVVTDGKTLLGADDKAGVAEIICAVERIIADKTHKHGRIGIAFTPDEEIGRGADLFNIEKFACDFAYTLDGGAFGEVEYETFNAAALKVTVHGVNIHPGAAKGKMINSIIVASEFLSMLPTMERPENTELREGFYHIVSVSGEVEETVMKFIIRDHDATILNYRKAYVARLAAELNRRYGEGTVVCDIKDSYSNMCEVISKHPAIIERARAAVRAVGGEPISLPVRGGTDGSRLSFMGLPCPNLGTGSHNHHGKFEYAVAGEMERSVDMILRLTSAEQ